MTINTETNPSTQALKSQVSSFFASCNFPESLSDLINEYAVEEFSCFGSEEYLKFFGANIVESPTPSWMTSIIGQSTSSWVTSSIPPAHYPKLPAAYFSWRMEFDKVDLANKNPNPRRNYETHNAAVYRPRYIREINSLSNASTPFTISLLRKLGKSSTICEATLDPISEKGCWLALRKDVLKNNHTYNEGINYIKQLNAGYSLSNSPIDLAICAVGQNLLNGELSLVDSSAYCEELQDVYERDEYGNHQRCKRNYVFCITFNGYFQFELTKVSSRSVEFNRGCHAIVRFYED